MGDGPNVKIFKNLNIYMQEFLKLSSFVRLNDLPVIFPFIDCI